MHSNIFHRYLPAIFHMLLSCSLIILGITIGMLIEKYKASNSIPGLQTIGGDVSQEVPLISLQKIENGVLYGNNTGQEVRFLIGADNPEIFPNSQGDFSFPVLEILPNLRQIPAPTGMQFVASSRGSKFWPLDAPQAAMLTVKNRVFFRNAQEAEAEGFQRGK